METDYDMNLKHNN